MTSHNQDDGESDDALVFAATIRPHRSLGPRGFRVLMILSSLVAAAAILRVVALGVWPVSGFFIIDLLGLYVAFRVSYRRARAFEEILLTRVAILFRKVSHRGVAREWRLNPLWTRLRRETHEEFGLQRLLLVSRGQEVDIAGELSPGERSHFADEFSRALAGVKRGY